MIVFQCKDDLVNDKAANWNTGEAFNATYKRRAGALNSEEICNKMQMTPISPPPISQNNNISSQYSVNKVNVSPRPSNNLINEQVSINQVTSPNAQNVSDANRR